MKLKNHHKLFICMLFFFGTSINNLVAQDSTASPTLLGIRYFLPENKVPYLEISTRKKVGRIFEPVKGIPVNVYFNEANAANFLGKIVTGPQGVGRVALPASLKASWDSMDEFKFLAVSDSIPGEEPLSGDLTIKKAILFIDTSSAEGIRSVTAQLKEKKGNDWVPVKEIEMKLGVKRLLGNLTAGEAETYTSDTTGTASAEFKRDSIPGDEKGNIILVARVEDNDSYGNLVVEKSVPWGKAVQADTHFWHRTLWSTGDRAPGWLLFLALSIILGVWGVVFYLVRQLFKIKKMGRDYDRKLST